MPTPPKRPSLYSSAIQQVLVLQEDDESHDNSADLSCPTEPTPSAASTAAQHSAPAEPSPRPWHDGLHQPLPTSPATPPPKPDAPLNPWRIRDRLKTANGALVLCLNIGVDPPDIVKPNPCARLECWIHPNLDQPVKSLNDISAALKAQYERWQSKARYKVAAEPVAADLKRICVALRRAAKDERVLFHYNGHGVPRPTANGEIWVFNHNYTQYIPLNLFDLHDVLGSPALYVFDCNSAGTILHHFRKMTDQLERDWQEARRKNRTSAPPLHRHSIMLAACADGQLLPTAPHLPADLFTSCLTTPIKALLRWFARRSLVQNITDAMLDRIPGNIVMRHTPLGELEYIFTAVTDTIAWNVLPRDTFKKLYRQDLLLASLMRNFMLADRIMRSYGCTPVSYPEFPQTHNHPLWHSFDLAVENLFAQLPDMLANAENHARAQGQEDLGGSMMMRGGRFSTAPSSAARFEDQNQPVSNGPLQSKQQHQQGQRADSTERQGDQHNDRPPQPSQDTADFQRHTTPLQQPSQHAPPPVHPEPIPAVPTFTYRSPTFFEDHMKAFNVWLDMGPDHREPPEQLPIMLQVLLTPALRLKALPLISRYMQTGPVAVDLALSVGIFPYVLRLLHNQSPGIRNDLVFIWSKILALDDTCRADLVKDKVDDYFVRFLKPRSDPRDEPKPVYLACAIFVLSVVARSKGDHCRATKTDEACFHRLSHKSPFVRRWACLCLTEIYLSATPPAQAEALDWSELLQRLRYCAEHDDAPDVRAAAVSSLAAIMNGVLKSLPAIDSPAAQLLSGNISLNFPNGFQNVPVQTPAATVPTTASQGEDGPQLNGSVPTANVNAVNLIALDRQESGSHNFPTPNAFSYSALEQKALLQVGKFLSTVASEEASVLVRREVAIAIAAAVRHQPERFIRAALLTDVATLDEIEVERSDTVTEECESILQDLWIALSELAFDPHPIIAAIARRSYDLISEKFNERVPKNDAESSADELLQLGHPMIDSVNEREFVCGTPDSVEGIQVALQDAGISPESPDMTMNGQWREQGLSNKTTPTMQSPQLRDCDSPTRDSSTARPPQNVSSVHTRRPQLPALNRLRKGAGAAEILPQGRVVTGSIRVRSTSGSFDLNVSTRHPFRSGMSRNNSVSMFPSSMSSSPQSGLAAIRPEGHTPPDRPTNPPPSHGQNPSQKEGPRSFPRVALAKGVGNLVKTVSQQFNLGVLGGGTDGPPGPITSNHRTDSFREREDVEAKSASPPRPPKRSLSYQVLNAASALSKQSEAPFFSPSRHTSYIPPTSVFGGSQENIDGLTKKLPSGYDRLFLSGGGNAALSLYEWSTAYISRVEFDAVTPDYLPEEEALPRYATLWNKLSQSKASASVAESLRAFALLGKGDDVLGLECPDDPQEENVSGTEISQSRELSLYSMGAGGGAVSAITFLPRDMGIGDDQLLATGDSTGSVGVYDARTGKCQGAFGIPTSPGISEEGISSIICLNPTTEDGATYGSSMPNSHSALILAGAYDGRVAVFKSNYAGANYRIMSTFQASGRTVWCGSNRLGARRQAGRAGLANQSVDINARMPCNTDVTSLSNYGNDERSSERASAAGEGGVQSFAEMMQQSGNGLALAFKSSQGYLAAGGRDGEIVRVWDLAHERCLWQGVAVAQGTWPTALSMWKSGDVNLFVVGSSGGSVNLIDMRERPASSASGYKEQRFGWHAEPIISIGTCPPERDSAGHELVVSADVGGEIVFWDPRWRNGQTFKPSGAGLEYEMRRIGAHQSHLTAMAVHQTGRYVASGSSKGVKIFGPCRSMLKMMCYHERGGGGGVNSTAGESDGGDRISAVTSLAFQHESSMLAVGCMDSSVMIYGRDRDLNPGV